MSKNHKDKELVNNLLRSAFLDLSQNNSAFGFCLVEFTNTVNLKRESRLCLKNETSRVIDILGQCRKINAKEVKIVSLTQENLQELDFTSMKVCTFVQNNNYYASKVIMEDRLTYSWILGVILGKAIDKDEYFTNILNGSVMGDTVDRHSMSYKNSCFKYLLYDIHNEEQQACIKEDDYMFEKYFNFDYFQKTISSCTDNDFTSTKLTSFISVFLKANVSEEQKVELLMSIIDRSLIKTDEYKIQVLLSGINISHSVVGTMLHNKLAQVGLIAAAKPKIDGGDLFRDTSDMALFHIDLSTIMLRYPLRVPLQNAQLFYLDSIKTLAKYVSQICRELYSNSIKNISFYHNGTNVGFLVQKVNEQPSPLVAALLGEVLDDILRSCCVQTANQNNMERSVTNYIDSKHFSSFVQTYVEKKRLEKGIASISAPESQSIDNTGSSLISEADGGGSLDSAQTLSPARKVNKL